MAGKFGSMHFGEAAKINQVLSMVSKHGLKYCKKCGLGMETPGSSIKFLYCGGCRGICYCSQECQKADWDDHRLVCQGQKATKTANGQSKAKKGEGSGHNMGK